MIPFLFLMKIKLRDVKSARMIDDTPRGTVNQEL